MTKLLNKINLINASYNSNIKDINFAKFTLEILKASYYLGITQKGIYQLIKCI